MISVALFAATLALPGDSPPCRFVARPIAAGEVIAVEDTVTGPCPGDGSPRRLRYDVSVKMARAITDLASGDDLGRVFLPQRPPVLPGDRIVLTAALGPIEITRTVIALQPGRTGQRFFVRDEAGQVFSAPSPAGIKP